MSTSYRLHLFGTSVRDVRRALGRSQADVARTIRRSQSFVSQVERGVASSLNVDDADRLCRALGATLVLGVEAPRLLDEGRTRDAAHARCVGHVERRLRNLGWQVHREVPVGTAQYPGWIDLLAWHPLRRTALVVEVKTELIDIGAVERQLGRYQGESVLVARRLGWRPAHRVSALVLLWTDRNDAVVRQNGTALAAAFPTRAVQLHGLAATGDPSAAVGPALAMIDPRSRARRWAKATVLDGRRTRAPYASYADFLRGSRRR